MTKALRMACSSGSWMIWLILLMGILIEKTIGEDETTTTAAPTAPPGKKTGDEQVARAAPEPTESLLKTFQNLYANISSLRDSTDCKLESSEAHNDHRHWGTVETLEFLSGMRPENKMSKAEKWMALNKTRLYLARIGYLKDPGSLVFVQKQIITLKLEGCPDGSIWRKQGGGTEEDTKYQGYGGSLKQHTDQPWSYINKYTCVDYNKPCSHTFYVITNISPDLPADFIVREGGKTAPHEFTCAVPYCNIQDCQQSATKVYNRRSYPPYFIYWDVPVSLKPLLGIESNELMPPLNATPSDLVAHPINKAGVQITWSLQRKKTKDETKLITISGDHKEWNNSFREEVVKKDRIGASFASTFAVSQADPAKHTGIVECVIIDGNGVVSTPNVEPGERLYDYRGDVNVHVLPRWQLWGPVAVSVVCILLVILIICICPRKMEHDDGTRYTKDEMVVPTGGDTGPQPMASEPQPSTSMEKQAEPEVKGDETNLQD
ncbi:hypothetical protein Ocin01_02566 [Orchesella cincta]|uniref:Uncharacterized protein n=1 Tax=Orchesella cincta TaxID=48709 RepID=A0A1D2NGL9_ORCCI|nr:hypothetical protein Ocin01_02566 [Orchesella cincta]